MALIDIILKYTRSLLAFIVVVSTIVFDFFIFFKAVPSENKELLYTAFGSLNTLSVAIVTYYFGSSKDKSDKEQADIHLAVKDAENAK